MIRLLEKSDWPALLSLLNSRQKFQGQAVDDSWHKRLKEVTEARLGRLGCWYHGYFDDETNELVGMIETHHGGNDHIGQFIFWAPFTKAGKDSRRYEGSNRSHIVMELYKAALLHLERLCGANVVWVTGPVVRSSDRAVEVKGFDLSDDTKWTRQDVGIVPAGTRSPDAWIDSYVMGKNLYATDHVLMKFTKIGPPSPEIESDGNTETDA